MKKLFTLVLLVIGLSINAQVSTFIGGGVGISSKQVMAGEVTAGLQINKLLINVNMLTHLSNVVDNQAALGFKLGSTVNINKQSNIELTGGVALNLRSTDIKQLNTISPAVSVVYVKDVFTQLYRDKLQTSQFYGGIHYIDRAVIGTVGIRMSILKN